MSNRVETRSGSLGSGTGHILSGSAHDYKPEQTDSGAMNIIHRIQPI